jgi:hypothetical protein
MTMNSLKKSQTSNSEILTNEIYTSLRFNKRKFNSEIVEK